MLHEQGMEGCRRVEPVRKAQVNGIVQRTINHHVMYGSMHLCSGADGYAVVEALLPPPFPPVPQTSQRGGRQCLRPAALPHARQLCPWHADAAGVGGAAPGAKHIVLHFGDTTALGSSHQLLRLALLAPRMHSRTAERVRIRQVQPFPTCRQCCCRLPCEAPAARLTCCEVNQAARNVPLVALCWPAPPAAANPAQGVPQPHCQQQPLQPRCLLTSYRQAS